jgi:predicted transcriptional regulator
MKMKPGNARLSVHIRISVDGLKRVDALAERWEMDRASVVRECLARGVAFKETQEPPKRTGAAL